MIIVKITFILILITAICIFFFRCWAQANPTKAITMSYKKDVPALCMFFGLLIIFDVIGIILSAIWFLFFYL